MSRHEKVHFFVETSEIDAIEIAAWPNYTSRAPDALRQAQPFRASRGSSRPSMDPACYAD
jgi:hypothetical protein